MDELAPPPTDVTASALDLAENMVVITSLDGTIVYVNRAFTDVTGYPREDAIGASPRLLRSGVQDEAFYRELWDTVLTGGTWDGELVNRRRDGTLYTDHMTITPLVDTGGAITHFVAVKRDVSTALDRVTAASPTGLVHTDVTGRLVYASRRACALLATSFEAALGLGWIRSFAVADAEVLQGSLRAAGSTADEQVLNLRHPSGRILRIHLARLADGAGTIGVVASIEDVTTEELALRDLEQREATVRSILDSLDSPTAVVDTDGVITAVNAAWRATGTASDARRSGVGVSYLEVCDRAAAAGCEDAGVVGAALRRVLVSGERPDPIEYALDAVDGAGTRWWELRIAPAAMVSGGAVLSHTDVTWRKDTEVLLRHRAEHDELTGLRNRAALVSDLGTHLGAAGRTRVLPQVLFLDLDGFKAVNDVHGHRAGDEVLREVARRLRLVTRADDIVARLGGDEFVVVCPLLQQGAMWDVAERIRRTVTEPIRLPDGPDVRVGVSIGVVTARAGESTDDVLRRADGAMYEVKSAAGKRQRASHG